MTIRLELIKFANASGIDVTVTIEAPVGSTLKLKEGLVKGGKTETLTFDPVTDVQSIKIGASDRERVHHDASELRGRLYASARVYTERERRIFSGLYPWRGQVEILTLCSRVRRAIHALRHRDRESPTGGHRLLGKAGTESARQSDA